MENSDPCFVSSKMCCDNIVEYTPCTVVHTLESRGTVKNYLKKVKTKTNVFFFFLFFIERERETDRQTERERQTERDRQREILGIRYWGIVMTASGNINASTKRYVKLLLTELQCWK